MKCQPIAPTKAMSFKLFKKNPENPEPKTNENIEVKMIFNGDTFEFKKLPQEDGILYK